MWPGGRYSEYNANYSFVPTFGSIGSVRQPRNEVPSSSSRNNESSSNFLSNVLSKNFSVEQLMDQYNRDLLSILEEQKEREEEILRIVDEETRQTPVEEQQQEQQQQQQEQQEQQQDSQPGQENPLPNELLIASLLQREKEKEKEESEEEGSMVMLKSEKTDIKSGLKKKTKKKKERLREYDFTFTEAEFLQKLLTTKKKIARLYKEYHELKKSLKELENEIKEILDIKDKLSDVYGLLNQCFFSYCMEKEYGEKINLVDEKDKLIHQMLDYILVAKQEEKKDKDKRMEELQSSILLYKKVITYEVQEDGSIGNPKDWLCSICVEDKKVQYCMEPCGHLFCEDCTKRIESSCHFCRNRVNKKIRMYF